MIKYNNRTNLMEAIEFNYLLNDVKDLLYKIEQRIYGMEVKIQDLQGSQNILEESLAYINKYLVEKN